MLYPLNPGTSDYKHEVSMSDVDEVDDGMCDDVSVLGCSEEFQELAEAAMTENDWDFPQSAEEGCAALFSLEGFY